MMLFKATAIRLPTDSHAGTLRSEADGSLIPPMQPSSKESFLACFAFGSILITSTSLKLRFTVSRLNGFDVKQFFHFPTFLKGALVTEPPALITEVVGTPTAWPNAASLSGALVTDVFHGGGGALATDVPGGGGALVTELPRVKARGGAPMFGWTLPSSSPNTCATHSRA